MKQRWQVDLKFIEQGDIYFFYKPRRGVERTSGLNDVARFFFVLNPDNNTPPRYVVMGGKRMPKLTDGGKVSWGFIQMVGGRGFETTRKQGPRPPRGSSRPAGEGIYVLVTHRDHIHLMYSLELPESVGEVQRAFNINREADYIFLTRGNEEEPENADLPFSNFTTADVHKLNEKGTEILLIGAGGDIGRMGIRANKDKEDLRTADIFEDLKMSKERHPTTSLISGNWV